MDLVIYIIMKKFITRRKIFIAIAVLLLLLLSGCGQGDKISSKGQDGYTTVDELGRTLHFKKVPTRIVSLSYTTDEIITALVPREHILTYSRWSGDPDISFLSKEKVTKVGQKPLDSQESIFSLRPDLVIVTNSSHMDLVSGMENMGVKVYVASSPRTFEETKTKVLKLAHALGQETKGKKIVKNMDERLNKLKERLQKIKDGKKKICVAFSFSGAMGRRGGLLDDIMQQAGLINGAALVDNGPTGSTIMSKEQIVRIDPDVFLIPTWQPNDKVDARAFREELKNDPAFQNLKAVKNDAMYYTNDKYRYVGSQYVIDAIEAHAKIVYPEIFQK